MAIADAGPSPVKGATERHMTAVTPEAAISAGARNQNPSKSPIEPPATKINNMASVSLSPCSRTNVSRDPTALENRFHVVGKALAANCAEIPTAVQ
jgi:hypothetical protein